jgi:hypothetical protein
VLARFDHITRVIVNANHGIMRAAEELSVIDCIIRLGVPQPTERQRIGNQVVVTVSIPRRWFLLDGHFGRFDYGKNGVSLFEVHSLDRAGRDD